MASLRLHALRHLTRRTPLTSYTNPQRRWAQVHDVRFLATTPRQQLILDKYKSKLDEKAQVEGFSTIEDLKAAYADKIAAERKRDAVAPEIPQAPETPVKQPMKDGLSIDPETLEKKETSETGEQSPRIPQAPDTPVKQPNADEPPITPPKPDIEQHQERVQRKASAGEKKGIKVLDDYLNLDNVRSLPEKDMTALWRLRHAKNPNTLCAAISADTYRIMEAAARKAPQFVLPVPHPEQGSEMHFLQWTFDAETKTSTVLFTQLAEYKMRGEFAQPHTTITHHEDLMEEPSKLVLMQGQTVEGRGVEPEQAKWLVLCLQRFYGGWETGGAELTGERKVRAEERRKLLELFAAGDESFSVDKLLDEAQRMG